LSGCNKEDTVDFIIIIILVVLLLTPTAPIPSPTISSLALPSREGLSNLCPSIAKVLMVFKDDPVFLLRPRSTIDIRVQMVDPPNGKKKKTS